MDKEDEVYGVPFHMAKHFYDELHALRIAKANAWINQEYDIALDCFIQMHAYVVFKLSPTEEQAIQELISKAKKYRILTTRSRGKQAVAYENLLRESCIEIDECLSKLLFKYNMLFPRQQVLGIEKINKRYNLQNEQDADDND